MVVIVVPPQHAGDCSAPFSEGSGTGDTSDSSPAQSHEFAAKAAQTDATKRALMTFGNAFGLSLYGGSADARAKPKNGGATAPSEGTRPETPKTSQSPQSNTTEPSLPTPKNVASEAEAATIPVSPKGPTLLVPFTPPHPNWPHFKPLDEAERKNADRQERVDKSARTLRAPADQKLGPPRLRGI